MAAGQCTCAHGLKTKAGVCGECYAGWKAGEGAVPGVDPKDVTLLPNATLQKLYPMKAEHFENQSARRRAYCGSAGTSTSSARLPARISSFSMAPRSSSYRARRPET